MYQCLSYLSVCFTLTMPLLVGYMTAIVPIPTQPTIQRQTWRYSQFMQAVESGQVLRVGISADRTFAIATTRQKQSVCVTLPPDPMLLDILVKKNVAIAVLPERMGSKLKNNGCR